MAKRDVRFNSISTLYGMHAQGYISTEVAKERFEFDELFLYEKELSKFFETFPSIDQAAFMDFAKEIDFIRTPQSKGGGGGISRKMETEEYARAKGVTPENMETYLKLIGSMRTLVKDLQEICPLGKVSFAIPLKKSASSKGEVPPVETEETSEGGDTATDPVDASEEIPAEDFTL